MTTESPFELLPSSPLYPDELRSLFGELAMPSLWLIGNIELLTRPGVGFCGSRNASEKGLQVAADCATQLSQREVVVISGYAPGVDMASHEAALRNGGSTIIVLAEGVDHFRIKKSIKSFWDWNRVLVISQFPKSAIWRPDRAMERNRLIVALSKVVIVLEARDSGGTLNAGFCALQMRRPLFVALYSEMNGAREGNERLIKEGGTPLRRSRQTEMAEMRGVFDAIGPQAALSDLA